MPGRFSSFPFLIAMSVVGFYAGKAVADEWPQWRGPQRDGVWREDGIIEKFPSKKLPIKWRAPISSGYSGPTVADGRVYVTDRGTEPKQIERVHCFDSTNGQPIWSHEYDAEYRDVGYQAGPRASVLIEKGKAYSLGTMGHLFCFDAADGRILWEKNLDQHYNIRMPIWGIAASPIIYKDLLIVQAGGENACLVAFDKISGEQRWTALDDNASYSAPIVIRQAGQDVLVCWTGDNVVGLDPSSGRMHWKHPFKPTRMVINIASPVVDTNRLFVSSFYDGSLMLRLDDKNLAVEQVWRRLGPDERKTESLHAMIGTPYMEGEYIYGVDSHGELRCLEAATGERIWESLAATPKARWSTIHMVRHDDRTVLFNERGELIFAKLTPKGYHEISRAMLIDPTEDQLRQRGGVVWSHPAYAYKHVFARNDKELVCANLAAE